MERPPLGSVAQAYTAGQASGRRPPLEVHRDDCDFGGIVPAVPLPAPALQLADGYASPTGTSPRRQSAGVYVQNMRVPSHFKSVPVERVRKKYSMSQGGFGTCSSGPGARSHNTKQCRYKAPRACSIAMLAAAALDEEVAQLAAFDVPDQSIVELLALGETCKLRLTVACFACQAILAGFSFVGGVVAFAADGDGLMKVMLAMGPSVGAITMACSEAGLVSWLLRALLASQRARAITATAAAAVASILETGDAGDQGLAAELSHDREVRRLAWEQTTFAAVVALIDVCIVACCMIVAQNDSGLFANGTSANWNENTTRSLIKLRAILAVAALIPACLDLQLLVAPLVHMGSLASVLGLGAHDSREAVVSGQREAVARPQSG